MVMTLTHLIERCESGSGADRELDAHIRAYFSGKPSEYVWPFVEGSKLDYLTGRYTTSLDAVVLLIEQKLPGAGLELEFVPNDKSRCVARLRSAGALPYHYGESASLARALLSATLRALQSKEASHE